MARAFPSLAVLALGLLPGLPTAAQKAAPPPAEEDAPSDFATGVSLGVPQLDPGPREGQRETVQARALLEKADRVRAKASEEDREELDRLAGRVRDAMTDRRWSDLQSACNDLSDVLFYLEDA